MNSRILVLNSENSDTTPTDTQGYRFTLNRPINDVKRIELLHCSMKGVTGYVGNTCLLLRMSGIDTTQTTTFRSGWVIPLMLDGSNNLNWNNGDFEQIDEAFQNLDEITVDVLNYNKTLLNCENIPLLLVLKVYY